MALLTNINGKFSVSDAGAVRFNDAFTFPTVDGTANYVLKTNGSGQLAWAPDANTGTVTGSGTANTMPVWTSASALGNSIITQPSSANVRVSGSSVYFSVTDTSAAARNIDIGHWVAGQTNIESVGGILSIGTQSNHDIVFETNGSTKATILANGNVGIGTNSPSSKLQVSGDAYVTEEFGQGVAIANKVTTYGAEFRSSGASAQVFFGRSGNDIGSGAIGADSSYVFRVWKPTDFSQPFVIEQGGNVGIGTTSPDSKLDVKGPSATPADGNQTLSITNSTGGTQLNLGTAENSYGWIEAREGSTLRNLLINPNGGNVGISETSPDSTLTVGGNFTATTTKPTVSVSNMTSGGSLGIRGLSPILAFDKTAGGVPKILMDGGGLEFKNGTLDAQGDVHLKIDSSGNVIIGNSSVDNPNSLDKVLEIEHGGSVGVILNDSRDTPIGLENRGAVFHLTHNTNSRLVVDGASGKVGIGVTDPDAKLEIKGTGASTGLTFKTTDSSDNEIFYIKDGGVVGVRYYPFKIGVPSGTANVANTRFQIATTGGDFVVLNDGKTGIGTTSPGRGLTIDKSNANAALEIIKKNTTNQIVYLGTGSSGGTDDPLLRMFHNTTENIRLYTTGDSWINGGNVGIGTTHPDSKLEVITSGANSVLELDNSNTNYTVIQYNASGATKGFSGFNAGFMLFGGEAGTTLRLQSGGSYAATILENGNFGIGTTSPLSTLDLGINGGQKFYVYANGSIRSGMGIDLSGSSRELSIFHTSSNNIDGDISLGLRNETSGQYVERMRVQGNGNVGIGTTGPVNKLGIQVAANSNTKAINIYSLNTSPNSYTSIGSQYSISNTYVESEIRFGNETQSGGGSYLGFVAGGSNSGNTEKMRITSAGNVGIGETSPTGKLHVKDGSVNALFVTSTTCGNVGIKTTSPNASLVVKGNVSYSYNNYSSVANTWSNALNFSGYPAGLYQINICKQSNASAYIIAQIKWSGTAGTVINTVTSFQYGITFSGTQLQSIINTTTASSISAQCLVTYELACV